MHLDGRSIGSSAFAIGGAHTQSGRPILAGDSHLEPTWPPLLYLVHVRGGALDVAGSTLPGVPIVWTGRNARVAWAVTNARAVTVDLYTETLHPADAALSRRP
jgi:penicillin amidase